MTRRLLSPTRAADLLACPLRYTWEVRPATRPPDRSARPPSTAAALGTAAHRAAEAWARSAEGQLPDAGLIAGHWEYQLAALEGSIGGDRLAAAGPRLTGKLLLARVRQLHGFLSGLPGPLRLRPELDLADEGAGIAGTLDLVAEDGSGSLWVVDWKTGRVVGAEGEVTTPARQQMLLYAVLASSCLGSWPSGLLLAALHTGLHRIHYEHAEAKSLLAALRAAEQAWDEGAREPRPAPDTCRFCRFRVGCGPHWQSAAGWEDSDAVEGVVTEAEQAANGRVALAVDDGKGGAVVTGLDVELLPPGQLVGQRVRAVRVRGRPAGRRTYEAGPWTELSALAHAG